MKKYKNIALLLALSLLGGCGAGSGSDGAVGVLPSSASDSVPAGPGIPLRHADQWITDREGRVLVMHGFNMVAKLPPYTPQSAGFSEDDADLLKANGFNAVRLGIIWKAIEPEPGQFNDAYLDEIADVVNMLGKRGVLSQIDFHQDAYNEKVAGQGFPDWTVLGVTLPVIPGTPLPGQMQPAQFLLWDHLWANENAPDGIPLWDHFATFWTRVAKRFAGNPYVLGYDLMNEPSAGTQTPFCLLGSCDIHATVRQFYDQTVAAIRQVDPVTPIHYENLLLADGPLYVADPNAVYSFHVYCPTSIPVAASGGALPTQINDQYCPGNEESDITDSTATAASHGHAALLTEFGSVSDMKLTERVASKADAHGIGWLHWAYINTGSSNIPGTPSVIYDPNKPASGDNVNQDLLMALARPYPQLVSGTPASWLFDSVSKQFDFSYTPARAGGKGSFPTGAETVVFLPKIQYPNGYVVTVKGVTWRASADGQTIVLKALDGASSMSLHVEAKAK